MSVSTLKRCPTAPKFLEIRPQWVLHRNKEPYQPNGDRASSTDLLTWSTFENVREAYERGSFDGIGFVFCSGDPYCGIDLDHVRHPITEEIEPWALDVIRQFPDAYVEISPSGTGVHIIAIGKAPEGGKKRGQFEMYSQERFFTFTGTVLEVPQ